MAIFGSIQVGSGARFASGNVTDSPFAPDVSTAQLESPPPPGDYAGLRTGPDFEIELEANEALPIDGSASILRTLSPFMIQVEPPLVYSGLDDSSKSDYAGLIAAGHRAAPAAFQSARNRIKQDIPGGDQSSNSGSVEQYVAQGYISKPKTASHVTTTETVGTTGSGRIGTPAITDVYTAADVTMQLRSLLETPPLILLINPQSLNIDYSKIQQYGDRTRFGFVFQAHGEEQPKMSISAKCGAFMSGGRGVQWASRRDSASFQNLANAFRFYRNNGYIYDTVGKSNAHHFVGALSIHYDGWVYYGNMESFSYAYDEGNQLGGVVFEMEFTINAMIDTSQTTNSVSPMQAPTASKSDPRYGGQGSQASTGEGDTVISSDGIIAAIMATTPIVSGDVPEETGINAMGTTATPGATAPTGDEGFQSTVTIPLDDGSYEREQDITSDEALPLDDGRDEIERDLTSDEALPPFGESGSERDLFVPPVHLTPFRIGS